MRQIYEYQPDIGFRFVPETKARVPHEGGGYMVRTNATGFRSDRPFQREITPGTRRILLFGDSFTAGEGVSNGQRYGDRLEQLVPGLEVFNFGLPATGMDQHYLIYKKYAQDIDHDLLVIAVFVENIRRVGSRYRYFLNEHGERVLYAKPYYLLNDGKLQLHGVPPPKLPIDPAQLPEGDEKHISAVERFPKLKRIFNRVKKHHWVDEMVVKSGLKDKALTALGYQPVNEYADPQNSAWLVMQELIRKWIGEHGKPVLLMPIPLHQYVYQISNPRHYQNRLRSATEAAGGNYFDPLPGLINYSQAQRRSFYFPIDGHLTKPGHEALADVMAPHISKLLSDSRPQ